VSLSSSCDSPRRTIVMRPTDVCHPTLYERVPILGCSRLIVRTCALRAPNELRSLRPRNRAFHDARIASAGRPASWGLFVPHESPAFAFASCGDQPLTPLSPPSLDPRAVFAATRLGEGCQDRFHPEHRDALEAFPTQGAFPRQRIRDSARPFQVADHESSSASRLCTSRFRRSASLYPRPPPERLLALRGFLW